MKNCPALSVVVVGLTWTLIRGAAGATPNDRTCQTYGYENAAKSAVEACTGLIARNPAIREKAANLYHRTKAYIVLRECDAAQSDIEEALKVWPSKTKSDDFYRELKVERVRVWHKCRGDLAKAISMWSDFIRDEPTNPRGYFYRAQTKQEARDYDGALADFEQSGRLVSDDDQRSALQNSMGLLWRDKGDYERALAAFNKAVRYTPRNPGALANRGEIYRLRGDLELSLADQSRAIGLDRTNSTLFALRGDTYRYRGEFEQAIKDYKAGLELETNSTPAYTGLGLTYERMGNADEARKMFVRAVSTPNPEQLTDIYRSSFETAKARLAALDSGEAPPLIPAAPLKVTSATSVPTPTLSISKTSSHEKAIQQGRRVALVIGNSDYKNVAALTNPKNDAEAVARLLRGIGFASVELVQDATREKLIDALRSFANEAETSDWAMVYYAGHGIEIGGINYLIPTDAKLAVDRDIEYEAVAVPQVLRAADSAKKIKLIMLDACRDNPFKPRKTDAPAAIASSESTAGRAIATRSTNGRGLAEVKVQGATLVVFAAKDGEVALDGEGANSPFAVAVVQRIGTPGVEINKIFRLVRDDVMEATAGRQEPYSYGSLPGKEDFFFVQK